MQFTIICHASHIINQSRSYVMNRTTNERIAYVMHNLNSLAHDSATMTLESHSRQSLGEDVCRLILACDFVSLHFGLDDV